MPGTRRIARVKNLDVHNNFRGEDQTIEARETKKKKKKERKKEEEEEEREGGEGEKKREREREREGEREHPAVGRNSLE